MAAISRYSHRLVSRVAVDTSSRWSMMLDKGYVGPPEDTTGSAPNCSNKRRYKSGGDR